jgi:hypothetical protein
MDFINLERTSSVAFRPNGVYKGRIVAVDETTNTVSLTLPRVNAKAVRNRCKVLSSTMPSIGDEVGCVFAENQASEVYVLGIIRNTQSYDTAPIIVCTSTTRPSDPLDGTLIYETDTTLGYFWTGTTWVSVEGSENQFGIVTLDSNGVGIGAATASQPLSIAQTSGTDYVSYNKSASAGLTNASAGAVIIGRATGPNVVVDSTTYAANNGTSASTALTGTVVQARNNGNPAALYLNPNGGDVRLETGGLVVNGDVTTLDGSSGRLKMPLSATYIDSGTMASARITGSYPNLDVDGAQIETGTVNFSRLGLAYPTASAPAASASIVGQQYYDTTSHEFLINSGNAYRRPWNIPWGIVKYGQLSTDVAVDTSQKTVLTVSSVSLLTNRVYEVSIVATTYFNTLAFITYTIYRGSTQVGIAQPTGLGSPGSDYHCIPITTIDTATTGTYSYTFRVQLGGGTGLVKGTTTSTFLTIKDIGPVAGSTPP